MLPFLRKDRTIKPWDQTGDKGGPDDQRGRLIGRTKGGLNTKLHAVIHTKGRPLKFFMTAGKVSDYTGAAALLVSLPAAESMIADRECDRGRGRELDQPKDDERSKCADPCTCGSIDGNG